MKEWERSSEVAGAHCSVDALRVVRPKRRAVPSRCWSGSCKEQVKSCTGHSGAGSTQKRGSGVGHQIKVFAFITSPPYRFIEDPHREAAAGGYSQQQEAPAGVAVEIANHCFLFIPALLEILRQEQWQQTCTGHPSSPKLGMHFQPGRSENLNPPCSGLPVERRLHCLSCCCCCS